MDSTINTELALIGDIYDAALKPELWPTVLDKISQVCSVKYINLMISDALNPDYLVVHSHGLSEDQIRFFQENDLSRLEKLSTDAWLAHEIQPGEVHANHILFGSIENYKHVMGDFYTQALVPIGSLWIAGLGLEITDFRYSTMGFHRGPDENCFSTQEIATLSRFAPHFRRAVEIHRQLTVVRQQNARLYDMLDRFVAGVLLLDSNGRIRFANPAAEKLLRHNHPALLVSVQQQIRTGNSSQMQELEQLISGAIRAGLRSSLSQEIHPQAGGVIGIQRTHSANPLMLTITPLSEMSGYASLASDGIAAGIFLSDPDASRPLARNLLQRHYLLTDRECDICELFLNCASIEGIADVSGLSLSTVRSYLRDIFEKTAQHSQAELMRLLMGLTIDFEHIR